MSIKQILQIGLYLQLLFVPLFLQGDDGSLPIRAVMTKEEEEAMGLNRASYNEKKAFEAWAAAWTRKVVDNAPSYHPSQSLLQWIQSFQKAQIPQQKKEKKEGEPQKLFRNNNGEELELEDGSVWRISPSDQYTARIWRRGNLISCEKTRDDIYFPYVIYNIPRGEQAYGALKKAASPSGRPKDTASSYQGAIGIKMISQIGDIITLQNGKEYDIAPIDQDRVQSNWKVRDRIKLLKNSDPRYPIRFVNLDSGDEVTGSIRTYKKIPGVRPTIAPTPISPEQEW